MPAKTKKTGSPDTGYHVVTCDECRDGAGRPWTIMHSRRTVEGARLAARDVAGHNKVHHPNHK
jgi:hypothetical protein